MAVGGKKRVDNGGDNSKYVGLFLAKVIAINPTIEEYKKVLGIELKEDSKATDYLGENKDGNTFLRVDFWLKNLTNDVPEKLKVTYFLENIERTNKDETNNQFINSVGQCSWAASEEELLSWFTKRAVRPAKVGEEDLYNFLTKWLGKLDYRDEDTTLELNWKNLMKGNVKEIKEQIGGEYATNVLMLATVSTKEDSDGNIKEYQQVYNKFILPEYTTKSFKTIDYSNSDVRDLLKEKTNKELKIHEKMIIQLYSEYGSKDFYVLKNIQEYDSSQNVAASNSEKHDDMEEYNSADY